MPSVKWHHRGCVVYDVTKSNMAGRKCGLRHINIHRGRATIGMERLSQWIQCMIPALRFIEIKMGTLYSHLILKGSRKLAPFLVSNCFNCIHSTEMITEFYGAWNQNELTLRFLPYWIKKRSSKIIMHSYCKIQFKTYWIKGRKKKINSYFDDVPDVVEMVKRTLPRTFFTIPKRKYIHRLLFITSMTKKCNYIKWFFTFLETISEWFKPTPPHGN